MKKAIYQVDGLNCNKCVQRVQKALLTVAGVSNALVTLHPPQAQVESADSIPAETLQVALSEAGEYRIHPPHEVSG